MNEEYIHECRKTIALNEMNVEQEYCTTISVPAHRFDEETLDNLRNFLTNYGVLIKAIINKDQLNLIIKKSRIEFPWFENTDESNLNTYKLFVRAICNMAIKQKEIHCTQSAGQNMYFACLHFLYCIGFDGELFRDDRQILLKDIIPYCTVTEVICDVKEIHPIEYLLDENGNEYYVDAEGREHYTRDEG